MIAVHRNAAELAVEIVNATRDGELDRAWASALSEREVLPVRHGPRAADPGGEALRRSLTVLAADLAPVFGAGELGTAAARLNDLLATLDLQVSVSVGRSWPPHLHFDAYGGTLGERIRVNCLTAIAALLADPSSALRIGECAAPSCDHVYADCSRSARQRFCSRRCATRSHVSEHRRRVAAG